MTRDHMSETARKPKIVFWGTYDLGKPRNRILAKALETKEADITFLHHDVWTGIEDKSQVSGIGTKIGLAWRWIAGYPKLLWRYACLGHQDAVLVGYPGVLDVLLLAPIAFIRREKIVWDMFICLYDTVVRDRKKFRKWHPVSVFLYLLEWVAVRLASYVLMDTKAHAAVVERLFRLKAGSVGTVYLGVEDQVFDITGDKPQKGSGGPLTILFYGQFIPLHGIKTIIEAARLSRDRCYRWVLIGDGQDAGKIRDMLETTDGDLDIVWKPWVPYSDLSVEIASADICLGIFGNSEKAASVIPNKVCQILRCGKPLITRDSPAIRELVETSEVGVKLVPPGNPQKLLDAVRDMEEEGLPQPRADLLEIMTQKAISNDLYKYLLK
ncbi:hypothetical protein GCM10017044_05480 [Kordiimonas sediminis]|uniref:Glycosyltransferase n=1 Tax=Kordiimonas sediminis TaxID=1735581 RepID=A0A919AMG3_9PROT|nr:glycosyltransferase [Kordiimonas sediminis]GHF14292.1 hypothetical protein GCM10017044_05480 [Kordiimonas sediminis]